MNESDCLKQLADVESGERFDAFVQLASREARATKNGDPFWIVELRDATGGVKSNIWQNSPVFAGVGELTPGDVVKIRAILTVHEQYGRQLDIDKIRPVGPQDDEDGYDPSLVVAASRFDRQRMFEELTERARDMDNEMLSQLVQSVLDEYADLLLSHPAAHHMHHPFLGGLLEHTWSVTETAAYLAQKYADYYECVDIDLVIAGAILHDVGKIRELDAANGMAEYSVEGRLLGHMLLGRDIVREHAGRIDDFPPQLLLIVEHLVVSHQGRLEWSSPVMPALPEALIVHYADDLDAKMNIMMRAIEADTGDDAFTPFCRPLERRVFKGFGSTDADNE